MCWVMPPASPSATCALRMASSSEVLPWSTWPMMVTTGGRGIELLRLVLGLGDELVNLEADLLHLPAVVDGEQARGVEIDGLVCVTIFPPAISLRIRSALFTPMPGTSPRA